MNSWTQFRNKKLGVLRIFEPFKKYKTILRTNSLM